jgi:hypothetical protein
MAIESGRRIGADLVERVLTPVSWVQQGTARLLGWFNQERWTNLLTILGLVLAQSGDPVVSATRDRIIVRSRSLSWR